MGISINFHNPEMSKRIADLREKASLELGKPATIQDMINLGYLKRLKWNQ